MRGVGGVAHTRETTPAGGTCGPGTSLAVYVVEEDAEFEIAVSPSPRHHEGTRTSVLGFSFAS